MTNLNNQKLITRLQTVLIRYPRQPLSGNTTDFTMLLLKDRHPSNEKYSVYSFN